MVGPLSVAQRRCRLVRRHFLDGSAADPVTAARSVVALHATDPATVYLSVLARCTGARLSDVANALYGERRLVRMMAMRRTLFVVPTELTATVHQAVARDLATRLRRRLVQELTTGPTDPQLPEAVEPWLTALEDDVERRVEQLGSASGAELARAEPRLATALLPRTDKRYDVRRAITSQVLVLMGTEGRLVRGRPLGSWTSRQHTWEPGSTVWPTGVPQMPVDQARASLVAAYLSRFGPAGEADIAWWTGWPLGVTRTAVAAVETEGPADGLVLAGDAAPEPPLAPSVALLPALDPTPMGWKVRGWFLPEDATALYDRSGNVGPTVWWGGEVVGGWAVGGDGRVRTRLLVDRGREVASAAAEAAAQLTERLEGAVVVPSFRTPLERELSGG